MSKDSLLLTSISPLLTEKDQVTIVDCFYEQLDKSNALDILVGYCSKASLEKLDTLIFQKGLKNICLILGMYYFEGFPKTLYELVIELNKKWCTLKVGEIRVIHSFKYHGKLYCFYKNKKFFSAILGSANFSFLGEKKENQRQYELATLFRNKKILKQISAHIEQIKQKDFSENISFLNNIQIISEKGETIPNIDPIETKKVAIVQKLQESNPRYVFHLPLKVPSYRNRFSPLRSNYSKSNLNACYGAPRGKGGPHRSWWEIQIIVSRKIINQKGYPKRGEWFYVITDDGYEFKAHVAGDKGKQFAPVGDETILGRWIKGRLVKLGIVNPVEDVSLDINREGMITKEMLEKYGGDVLVLKNTGEKKLDEEGVFRNVWFLSFPRKVISY